MEIDLDLSKCMGKSKLNCVRKVIIFLMEKEDITISFEQTEPGEHIGQRAYYTGSATATLGAGQCELFGTELTIVGETANNVLAQINKTNACVGFLILRKDSADLSVPVTDY